MPKWQPYRYGRVTELQDYIMRVTEWASTDGSASSRTSDINREVPPDNKASQRQLQYLTELMLGRGLDMRGLSSLTQSEADSMIRTLKNYRRSDPAPPKDHVFGTAQALSYLEQQGLRLSETKFKKLTRKGLIEGVFHKGHRRYSAFALHAFLRNYSNDRVKASSEAGPSIK